MTATVRFVGSGDSFGSGGRFQTCILVDGGGTRFAIDFGTSSLIALHQQGIEHNSIDAVLLTHLHGDHCGGVPFMLMDAMLGARRRRPLTIAGPRETRARLEAIAEALFPGSDVMVPKFPLEYVEMETGRANTVGALRVTPYAAKHTWQTNPTFLRVERRKKEKEKRAGEAGSHPASWRDGAGCARVVPGRMDAFGEWSYNASARWAYSSVG